MSTTYDAVAYPTVPRALAHPAHLRAVATMYGLAAAPVETARVLEIGCGDAGHLIACAAALPSATFVGFDLSPVAVARGQKTARDAGLTNVTLEVGDITTWQPRGGPFDYVVSDGIYSWVPTPVRDALMALVGRSLSPEGLAFFSYNVYPGCYTRRMLWEMMRFHVDGIEDPEAKIDEAMRMADFVRASRQKPDGPKRDPFDRDVDNVLNNRVRNILYHDELSPVNDPVYFHQFAAHAVVHGLNFVSESLPQSIGFTTLPPAVIERIEAFAGGDSLKREQYVDFATLRRFRQSIVAAAPCRPSPSPVAAAIRELYLAGGAKAESVDFAPGVPMTFRVDENRIVIRTPLTKAALVALAECQPQRLTFEETLRAALAKLGRDSATDSEVKELLDDLVTAWTAGGVLVKGTRPSYAPTVSERPTASALARVQLREGTVATSLLHTTIRFEDPPSRMLVQLLDGTRTVEQIAAELYPLFPAEHRPPPAEFRAGLARNLAMLADGGFLIA